MSFPFLSPLIFSKPRAKLSMIKLGYICIMGRFLLHIIAMMRQAGT